MTDEKKFREVRFYCPECEEEVWDKMDLNAFASSTLGELMRDSICAECMMREIKEVEEDNVHRVMKKWKRISGRQIDNEK